MITDNDLRWLAGVVDSRGCISSYAREGKRYIVLSINDNNQELISELSKIIGVQGIFQSERLYDRRACATHCPEKHIHTHLRPGQRIDVRGSRGYVVLWNILPFLRVRRSEVSEKLSQVVLSDISWGPTAHTLGRMASDGWQIPDQEN